MVTEAYKPFQISAPAATPPVGIIYLRMLALGTWCPANPTPPPPPSYFFLANHQQSNELQLNNLVNHAHCLHSAGNLLRTFMNQTFFRFSLVNSNFLTFFCFSVKNEQNSRESSHFPWFRPGSESVFFVFTFVFQEKKLIQTCKKWPNFS